MSLDAHQVFGILVFMYLLPTFVAGIRHHHNTAAIAVLNILLGWTGLGWIASLVWSATSVAAPAR